MNDTKKIWVGRLQVEILPSGRDYRLTAPLHVFLHQVWHEVPAGFVTDFASVPRLLWTIFPPSGKWSPAAVWHDWRYQFGTIPRPQADAEFLDLMAAVGVPRFTRWAMYAGVRAGGWMAWNSYARMRHFMGEMGEGETSEADNG